MLESKKLVSYKEKILTRHKLVGNNKKKIKFPTDTNFKQRERKINFREKLEKQRGQGKKNKLE